MSTIVVLLNQTTVNEALIPVLKQAYHFARTEMAAKAGQRDLDANDSVGRQANSAIQQASAVDHRPNKLNVS